MIDERTNHLCSVRFEMRQNVVAAGYSTAIELNIADVDGASLVGDGTLAFTGRAIGIGIKRVTMAFAYHNIAFPEHLPGDVFL